MTHTAAAAERSAASAATLPLAASIILAVLWGAYTVLVCIEIFSIPLSTTAG